MGQLTVIVGGLDNDNVVNHDNNDDGDGNNRALV